MKPKFEIGDQVACSPTLYGETRGTIYERQKIFKEIYPQRVGEEDEFDEEGLATLENHIENCCLPYQFDGEYYIVFSPQHGFESIRISKFKGWAYTVKTEKMSSIFGERQLSKKLR